MLISSEFHFSSLLTCHLVKEREMAKIWKQGEEQRELGNLAIEQITPDLSKFYLR